MEGFAGLSHLYVTIFLSGFGGVIALTAITDVTMDALCPGQDQCSLAIYLTGIQQAKKKLSKSGIVLQVAGVGSVLVTPLIGNLSDKYGRKTLITLPLTLTVIPQVILAYSRETKFFYAYYAVKTLAAMVGEGSFHCLSCTYVADMVPHGKRTSSFGALAGVGSATFVCGSLAARFLSTALTFQVAAVSSMIALVYMRIFLKESVPGVGTSQPLLKEGEEPCPGDDSSRKTTAFKKLPSLWDLIRLLKCSPTFSQVAIVSFFNSLVASGLLAVLLYYLKARFQFNKDQFATTMMITAVGATFAQLFFMPLLVSVMGEEKLLSTALLVNCIDVLVYSVAWSPWVPYALAVFSVFSVFSGPSLSSIASKQVESNEQGMVQGCLSGISSFASIIAPLVISPLTDDSICSESNDPCCSSSSYCGWHN
ncbi:unnamed protein product [Sphenostylis stenocarpa]|uniref:Major facilitator superfamily (MFS) profile domain-containing protein n=1 Tax=Sphenostylis stenocarpa TaxID=92480 RepID=A0AA87BA00_9FABA|nr:unnamed protein product [Sphenostylis stenocarpa]